MDKPQYKAHDKDATSSAGNIRKVDITEELSKNYLDYAMSVIVARALPDIRDGLKPVHRRILYAMQDMGLLTSGYRKSATIVGEVLGKYHPHGDTAVYDAMVRMAQDFSMRYPLVDGQGNFGSVDGDPAAAMRYTEVKLPKIAEPLLLDIDKETVDFVDNFDATIKEPAFLPALLPNLLLMGSEGIAVGMATKIPPHNLSEVIDGVIATIKKGRSTILPEDHAKEVQFYLDKINLIAGNVNEKFTEEELRPKQVGFDSDITVAEITEDITGPDFPTGGAIYDAKSLVEVYETGRGRIVVRGIADIVEGAKGKTQIIISEIPYQVNKATLVEQIADLVKNKRIVGIAALRDESDKDGLRVVADLKRDGKPKSVLNNIYKYTRLQTTFPANFVALVDGTPYTVNLKQVLVEYVRHRQRVITRRTIFELTAAKKRSHILEGLKIALDHLDEVIKTIRASKTQDEAKKNLIEKFKFSDIQATAILDMQLRRLAALEREKIEKELAEMMKLIDKLIAILKDPKQVLQIIETELLDVKERFGDKRKTKIYKQKIGEISEEDLIAKEETLITITKTGYIKRLSSTSFKSQHRGGKGVVGMGTKEEDEIEHLLSATTHDMILFFTDKGRVFGTKAWDIVEGTRQSKGQALVNLINLEQGEQIKSILPLNGNAKHLIMATANGIVKKSSVSEFTNLRANGLIAIKLDKTDQLVGVHATNGEDFVLILTKNGKSIKFPEANVRSMGRATTGVRGMKLGAGDSVIGMEVFPKEKDGRFILTVSDNGLGKKTRVDLFPTQKRGGSGVKAVTISAKTGTLASAIMINETINQVIITSKHGQVVKLALKDVPELGRATQGVILMRFAKKGDNVAAVTTLVGGVEEE
ncbi:DNA topoisomerase (ATP-hydrolyzing) subunit A [soil metagenome]